MRITEIAVGDHLSVNGNVFRIDKIHPSAVDIAGRVIDVSCSIELTFVGQIMDGEGESEPSTD